jgi:hypothetical protein
MRVLSGFVWNQAAKSKRINRTRVRTARADTSCRFCGKLDTDDLNHILLCAADRPRRRVEIYLRGLQEGMKSRHGELEQTVTDWVTAMTQGRITHPGEDADRELAHFLRGLWPDVICQRVAQLPEHNEDDDDIWPAQALNWAGRHLHRVLWRPLWKLRKEAKEPDDDAESTSTEAPDNERDDA